MINARVVRGDDGREVVQMRVDLGVLQLEVAGRPDGQRPKGYETYFDYLVSRTVRDEAFQLRDRQRAEVDRELAQFYHRRICWLTLRQFARAVADADHTLALMDFCIEHCADEHWMLTHERYRPFVLFHRIQAAALDHLERHAPDEALRTIDAGLEQLRELLVVRDSEESDGELIERLTDLRASLHDHAPAEPTLEEQLRDAVAQEQYELAAQIRDELARQRTRTGQ